MAVKKGTPETIKVVSLNSVQMDGKSYLPGGDPWDCPMAEYGRLKELNAVKPYAPEPDEDEVKAKSEKSAIQSALDKAHAAEEKAKQEELARKKLEAELNELKAAQAEESTAKK